MHCESARQMIRSHNRIVILSGVGMSNDSGIPDFRSAEEAYKTELEFDYSPEDLYSSVFYNTRPELFFRYYKKYVLFLGGKPNPGHYAIAELEKQGKVTGIITKSIYGLHQAAESKKVMELHGTIHTNKCTSCGKVYSAEYIKEAKGIPTCKDCESIIRPKVSLYGEMVDNGVLTQAINAVEQADVAIIAGADYNHASPQMKYFKGKCIILINELPHYSDNQADIIFHGHPAEFLPEIIF